MPDDYELLPHEEIIKLKREIEKLKSDPTKNPGALADSMESLSTSMDSLLDVFKVAAEEMKLDEHDAEMMADRITPLMQKIDRVLEQNEKIARGIVAIADMIEEIKPGAGLRRRSPSPSYARPMSGSPNIAPPTTPTYHPPIQSPGPAPTSSYSPAQQPARPSAPPSFSSSSSMPPKPLPPTVPNQHKDPGAHKKEPLFKLKF